MELPHELPESPLHAEVLPVLVLVLALPADDQDVVVLNLHLDLAGLDPRHVDDEDVVAGVLLDVGGGGGHGLRVLDVGSSRRIEGLLHLFRDGHQVLQRGEEGVLHSEHPHIHFALRRSPICWKEERRMVFILVAEVSRKRRVVAAICFPAKCRRVEWRLSSPLCFPAGDGFSPSLSSL